MTRSIERRPKRLAAAAAVVALLAAVAPPGRSAESSHVARTHEGEKPLEQQGVTVAFAGDVDGDGTNDLLAGLVTVPTVAEGNHVSARLYSGATGLVLRTYPAPVPQHLPSLNSVLGPGDVDGDGRADVAIGTPEATAGVVEFAGIVRIFNADGVLLGEIPGPVTSARFAYALAAPGDVNHDGIPDILIGAPDLDRAYIYSGDPALDFPLLAQLSGLQPEERFGASVGRLRPGEDGVRRLSGLVLVGAPFYDRPEPDLKRDNGRVYVFDLRDPGTPLWMVEGDDDYHFLGSDVDGGGDLDSDGRPDFVAGAMATGAAGLPGTGYVRSYSGTDAAPLRTISSDSVGDLFGFSVALGGRCGGDPTIVVGAPGALDPGSGKQKGRAAIFDAASGDEIARVFGLSALEALGTSVSGAPSAEPAAEARFLAGAPGRDVSGGSVGGALLVVVCDEILRPHIVLSPDPAAFPATPLGASSPLVVEVRNEGDALLEVSSTEVTVASSPSFSVSGGGGAFAVEPGGTHLVDLDFSPDAPGVQFGTLRLLSNDPETPVADLPLTGAGTFIGIEVDPESVDFGEVPVGDASWRTIYVRNVGNVTLQVTSIELPGAPDEFQLGGLPDLPRDLAPESFISFQAIFEPDAEEAAGAQVIVASDVPGQSSIPVPLSGTGVSPEIPPTAVIQMDVPYGGEASIIQFRSSASFDVDGFIAGRLWSFGHGGETSGALNPLHELPVYDLAAGAVPFTVRLRVSDDEGLEHTTSITALTSPRPLRSRFHGRVFYGGSFVSEGTVVEAWINGFKAVDCAVHRHLGRSVYALEIPPLSTGGGFGDPHGGTDGDTVVFRLLGQNAPQQGTWFRATDQELDLQIPIHIGPELASPDEPDRWCLLLPGGLIACSDIAPLPPGGIDVEVGFGSPPAPLPAPLEPIVTPFEVTATETRGGGTLALMPSIWEIHASYSPSRLEILGIDDLTSIGIYHWSGRSWGEVGRVDVDSRTRTMTARLRETGVLAFAARGTGLPEDAPFLRGDVNGDGERDISDPITLLLDLFVRQGAPASCLAASDVNDDGSANVSDAVALLRFLFTPDLGAPDLPQGCEVDATPDGLPCERHPACP